MTTPPLNNRTSGMIGSKRCAFGLLVVASVLMASCASVRLDEDIADYADAIEDLERQAVRAPDDARPLRDLGVIYVRTSDFARANEKLQLAFSRDPDDPKTLFYLGLTNETLGREQTALRLFERYPEFSRLNPYRRLMAGRYAFIQRKTVREAMLQRVTNETDLVAEGVDPRVVAVYPLTYQGADEQYAALGRGLAELLSIDLGHIEALQLVERVRLQTLLDEINLAGSEYFDPVSAPRVGLLVGAGRLIGGVYNVLGDDLQLDAALWEVERADVADLGTRTGALSTLFDLEKELVFSALAEMGIEPTEEERRRIDFVPTQNLQAFLAFSRGLEREDAGAFDEAASFYGQAVELDPTFRQASQRAEEVEGQAEVSGDLSTALEAAYGQDPFPPLPVGIDLLGNRLLHLNIGVGSNVVPGVDPREGASEAALGGAAIGRLPDPPKPPPGTN